VEHTRRDIAAGHKGPPEAPTLAMQAFTSQTSWLHGFVSGVAYARGRVPVGNQGNYEAWFGAYCAEHPDALWNTAAGHMVEALFPDR
jgi:hypothetical protein